jgi:hypothetical protein
MAQSNYKYRNWVFTWDVSTATNHLVLETVLSNYLRDNTEKYAFQLEQGDQAGKKHWQGCFRTTNRVRHSTLLNRFKAVHPSLDITYLTIDKMEGDLDEAVSYCTKEETRVEGYLPNISTNLQKYSGTDIQFLNDRLQWYPWQTTLFEELYSESKGVFTNPDDRKILWIEDIAGNHGKSKFVKYMAFSYPGVIKLSFGTAAQLRSSVVAAGPQSVYFLDIPRTLGSDDSLDSSLSVIEDIKNGYVVSAMYGKYETLMFKPPHVVCFSNTSPSISKMSLDRWYTRYICVHSKKLVGKTYA